MQQKQKTKWSVYTLIYMALMIAIQITLSRLLVIEIGPTLRLSFGSLATILAGLWLGPLAGGICGMAADILGCFLRGYAVNPLITTAAILWGVIPALAVRNGWYISRTKKGKIAVLCLSIAVTGVLSSLILTTLGLVMFYSMNFWAVLPGRALQALVMIPCYCILACTLYFSPLTGMIMKQTAAPETNKYKNT